MTVIMKFGTVIVRAYLIGGGIVFAHECSFLFLHEEIKFIKLMVPIQNST